MSLLTRLSQTTVDIHGVAVPLPPFGTEGRHVADKAMLLNRAAPL
jgi:hypothetical protein